MNGGFVLALEFGIGLVAGLRTFTAPAVTAWAAQYRRVCRYYSDGPTHNFRFARSGASGKLSMKPDLIPEVIKDVRELLHT
jgi:hypothetical protein